MRIIKDYITSKDRMRHLVTNRVTARVTGISAAKSGSSQPTICLPISIDPSVQYVKKLVWYAFGVRN